MIIQCPSCRELARAERAVLDDEGARAGVVCSACGAVAWLPLATEAALENDEPGERRQAPAGGVDPQLEEALSLPAEGPTVAPLVEELRALGPRWDDYEAHRALIRRAHALGAMPALGVRYRRVLQARPGDEVATRAQQEILTLAMASLSTMAGSGALDSEAAAERRKRRQAVAALVVVALFLLLAVAILGVTLEGR